MILPIRIYGDPILRTPTEPVSESTEELRTLIDNMIETMYGASGIGLAAPQVGRLERLFVIDLSPLLEDLKVEGMEQHGAIPPIPLDRPHVFINPEILESSEEEVEFEEGCLSIPDIREPVWRPERIRLRYLTADMEPREIEASGMLARVLQHEYDHLHGILFTDLISPFRQRMLRRKLREIARGEVEADYPILTPAASRS